MNITVRKIGNSEGVILPKEVLERLIIQLVLMVAAGEIDEIGAAAFFRDHIQPVETA